VTLTANSPIAITLALDDSPHTDKHHLLLASIRARLDDEWPQVSSPSYVPKVCAAVRAHTSDTQRQAYKKLLEASGFSLQRIINRPTLACIARHLDKPCDGHDKRAMVLDWCDSTHLDRTLVTIEDGVFEITAHVRLNDVQQKHNWVHAWCRRVLDAEVGHVLPDDQETCEATAGLARVFTHQGDNAKEGIWFCGRHLAPHLWTSTLGVQNLTSGPGAFRLPASGQHVHHLVCVGGLFALFDRHLLRVIQTWVDTEKLDMVVHADDGPGSCTLVAQGLALQSAILGGHSSHEQMPLSMGRMPPPSPRLAFVISVRTGVHFLTPLVASSTLLPHTCTRLFQPAAQKQSRVLVDLYLGPYAWPHQCLRIAHCWIELVSPTVSLTTAITRDGRITCQTTTGTILVADFRMGAMSLTDTGLCQTV
jgi:hypothetical protein